MDGGTCLVASSAGGTGLIPGWRAKTPYTSWPENESINDIVINSIKNLKMVHIKKKKLRKKRNMKRHRRALNANCRVEETSIQRLHPVNASIRHSGEDKTTETVK